MNRRALIRLFAASVVPLWAERLWAAPRLAVIVNAKNPIRSLGPDELEAIFKALRRNWPGGQRIQPFNLPPRHGVRVAFDRAALHMEPEAVARYWIDQRIRGGQQPPTQVPDSTLMQRVVSSLSGAIGYVPVNEVANGIKVVAEV
jgi:ABC-type phosphate transport system substrate-binding protein